MVNMLKVVRIICIWTYCICCLCGHTQLPTAAAIPYEYFDDHDELFYDLETEQSKAKYDSHLLAQQLRKDQNVENIFSNDFNVNTIMHSNEQRDEEEQDDDDDLEPHARAASCFTGGRRYTHGQKVPRLDNCEVCLCMDGEIFCWWEKCDPKKPTTQASVKQKQSTATSTSTTSTKSWQHIETSTQTNGRKTNGNQLKQYQQQRQQQEQQQQQQQLHVESQWKTGNEQVSSEQSWKKLSNVEKQNDKKKKAYDKSMYEETNENQNQQQQQQQQHVMMLEHKSTSQSNKIFNFPENLPSVLYYDYRTEEHQQHQNIHHQQHLKHQKQLQQQEQYQNKHSDNNTEQQQKETSALLFSSDINEHTYFKNEGDIDSDILPEPPTKKPKVIQTAVGNETTHSYLKSSEQTLSTALIQLNDTKENSTQVAVKSVKQEQSRTTTNTYEYDNPDEAFHRWLMSSSSQSNNDTFYNADVEGAGIVSQQNVTTETATMLDTWKSINMDKHHLHNVLFNGTDNSSSSSTTDTNKGILDIDILLTANIDNQLEQQTELQPDKEKLQQWQQKHQIEQVKRLQKDSIILEPDLILKSSQTTPATTTTTTDYTTIQTSTAEPHCNVMGTYYKIGDVLPQDAGNCLQCVCIEGTSTDRTPRVTCSPHNCPPLVLPDMLDATGY